MSGAAPGAGAAAIAAPATSGARHAKDHPPIVAERNHPPNRDMSPPVSSGILTQGLPRRNLHSPWAAQQVAGHG